MKKGILVVPFMTGYGGTETVIGNLFKARKASPQDFKLKVYSIGGSFDYGWAEDVDLDIKWINKKRKIRDLYAMTIMPFNLLNYIRREHPAFVISTNPVIWYLAKVCLRLLHRNTPVIAWYHYSIDQKPIKKLFLDAVDYYLAISSGIKRQLISRGIPADRIFLVLNPITTDGHIIKRPDDIHFVYMGRIMLDGQKNLRELMDALALLKGKWILDLYGNEAQASDVKNYANTKGIAQNIVWHGFVNNPWEKLDQATALLLTSKYEGLPMVLCEAVSHGVYCVSANTSTGPEDIINNQNGSLYTLGDAKKLAEILQSIINGKKLPAQYDIQETATKFLPVEYLKRFNEAITTILNKEMEK